jgi:hypothetical protein
MDTILSGTVPLFTRREQYEVLPDWIDWKQLSYFVPLYLEEEDNATNTNMNATSATTATNRRRHDFWSRLQREFDD